MAKEVSVNWKRALVLGLSLGFLAILVLYGSSFISIKLEVKKISDEAGQIYPGDRIEALLAYVASEEQAMDKRIVAVWALGELRDQRALSTLEKFYTGGPCDHAKYLCQDELAKAIKKIKGEMPNPWCFWKR